MYPVWTPPNPLQSAERGPGQRVTVNGVDGNCCLINQTARCCWKCFEVEKSHATIFHHQELLITSVFSYLFTHLAYNQPKIKTSWLSFINCLICEYSLFNISWRFHYRSSWFEICLFGIWEASSWSYITPHCLPKEVFWAYTSSVPRQLCGTFHYSAPSEPFLFADVILVERKSEQDYYSLHFNICFYFRTILKCILYFSLVLVSFRECCYC